MLGGEHQSRIGIRKHQPTATDTSQPAGRDGERLVVLGMAGDDQRTSACNPIRVTNSTHE
ncbi:MAG: hypothetical protein K0S05_3334, partial [Agromyces sp.]|nr:hypothetical protein [Agromyces sp.]